MKDFIQTLYKFTILRRDLSYDLEIPVRSVKRSECTRDPQRREHADEIDFCAQRVGTRLVSRGLQQSRPALGLRAPPGGVAVAAGLGVRGARSGRAGFPHPRRRPHLPPPLCARAWVRPSVCSLDVSGNFQPGSERVSERGRERSTEASRAGRGGFATRAARLRADGFPCPCAPPACRRRRPRPARGPAPAAQAGAQGPAAPGPPRASLPAPQPWRAAEPPARATTRLGLPPVRAAPQREPAGAERPRRTSRVPSEARRGCRPLVTGV